MHMANIQNLNKQQIRQINQSIPALGNEGSTVPNRLSAGDILNSLFNLGGNVVTYTTNATANTQDTIPHGLPYVPRGYLVINKGAAVDLYDGGTAWNVTNLYLKATVANVPVTLIVF